jgi:predicted 2-oxoglutarate/Fe(II)-dependent dioxygenase YbiX
MKVRKLNVEGFYPSQNVTDVFIIEDILYAGEYTSLRKKLDGADKTLRVDDRFRNNDRITFNDPEFAAEIFKKISGAVELHNEEGFSPVGCNPRFHIYRYGEPGDQFTLHADQPYILDDTISFYTVLFYLSLDYEGGEVLIGGTEKFRAKAGSALVFPHYMLHGAAPLVSGTRYTMRTDVMYRSAKLGEIHNLGRDEVLP